MDELRQHKNVDKLKWVLTLIAFIIVSIVLCGIVFEWFKLKNEKSEENGSTTEQTDAGNSNVNEGFATNFKSTKHVKLMSAGPMTKAATGDYIEQTLKATVLPDTAINKAVDWMVTWADEGHDENVTDYVTVTPSSDGSTTASVKCYQPFNGDIVVTVTTRENGYTAECIVTFVGIPSEINLSGPFPEQSDGYYYVGVGGTYSYSVDFNNIFGTVGADYQDVSVTLGGYGSVVLGTYEYHTQTGSSEWYDTSFTTVTLESLKDNFLSFEYSNGVLNITTIKTVESYYESMKRLDGGRTRNYTNKFKEYATDDAYFYLKIEQNDTGLSKLMKIKFDTTVVAGVNTNQTQILF